MAKRTRSTWYLSLALAVALVAAACADDATDTTTSTTAPAATTTTAGDDTTTTTEEPEMSFVEAMNEKLGGVGRRPRGRLGSGRRSVDGGSHRLLP